MVSYTYDAWRNIARVINNLSNNNLATHSPFELLIGVLTSENADLPSWMSINAFYVQEAFLQGLSLASFSIGVLDATFHTPKWFSSLPDDHLANPNIYLGVGTWNANLSLGLGASGTAEILSGSIGVRFGDAIDVGVKGYIGIGFTLDFSEGIKLVLVLVWDLRLL